MRHYGASRDDRTQPYWLADRPPRGAAQSHRAQRQSARSLGRSQPLKHDLEADRALIAMWDIRGAFPDRGGVQSERGAGPDVRQLLRRGPKREQKSQALGRSRGRFGTQIHFDWTSKLAPSNPTPPGARPATDANPGSGPRSPHLSASRAVMTNARAGCGPRSAFFCRAGEAYCEQTRYGIGQSY